MPPFACNCVRTPEEATIDDDAPAHPRTQDGTEDTAGTGGRAVDRFRKGEAVRIILDPDVGAEQGRQIAREGAAIEPRAVGILDETGRRGNRARNPDADPGIDVRGLARLTTEASDGLEGRLVLVTRRRDPATGQKVAGGIEDGGFDLRAAEINAEMVGRLVGHDIRPGVRVVLRYTGVSGYLQLTQSLYHPPSGVERARALSRGRRVVVALPRARTGKAVRMPKTVLIVEDNELNMKLFNDLLEAHGYTTLKTNDGIRALGIARESKPDLILMDIQLPEVSGLEVTKWLKEDEELKHIPVVAVTAFAMKGDEEKIRQGGCEDYIAKPITVSNFLDTVQRYIG